METAIDKARRELATLEASEKHLMGTIAYLNETYSNKTFVTRGTHQSKYIEIIHYYEFKLQNPFNQWEVKYDQAGIQFSHKYAPVSFGSIIGGTKTGKDRSLTRVDHEVQRSQLTGLIKMVESMVKTVAKRLSLDGGFRLNDGDDLVIEDPTGVVFDLPHIVLDDEERDILSDSPFLCGNRLLTSPESIRYSLECLNSRQSNLAYMSTLYDSDDSRHTDAQTELFTRLFKRLRANHA